MITYIYVAGVLSRSTSLKSLKHYQNEVYNRYIDIFILISSPFCVLLQCNGQS